jgi:DNA repair protein RadC
MNTSAISLIAQLADGSSRAATPEEIISAAREHMSRRIRRGTQLTSPKATRDYLSLKLGTLEREVFVVILISVTGLSVTRRCFRARSTGRRSTRARS